MAAKLDEDMLAKLGVAKLAGLVLDEAQRNVRFRRQVSAALAASKGPDAVAAIIDQRLSGFERARGYIDWPGMKGFADDLRATLAIITDELALADPGAALDRIVRFLGVAPGVFVRVDDSNGRVQEIFHNAAGAIPALAARLSAKQKASLPERLHRCLVDDDHGFCRGILAKLLPVMPTASIATWDTRLVEEIRSLGATKTRQEDWQKRAKADRLIRLRQAIADHRGDCDAFIVLEEARGRALDMLAVAERLLKAGRHGEALEWVRKPSPHRAALLDWEHGVSGSAASDPVRLELRVLDAKGDGEAAQALRWSTYLETLDIPILRDYVDKLADFEEFDVLERAFTHAAAFKDYYRALQLFIAWPKLDLASQLVLRNSWDGRRYDALRPAAEVLETSHPAAATILYRALLDHILDQARAQAYGHAARYFANLEALAHRLPPDAACGSHATHRAELQKRHGRKSSFWDQITEPNRG